jgi:hypothetical protein
VPHDRQRIAVAERQEDADQGDKQEAGKPYHLIQSRPSLDASDHAAMAGSGAVWFSFGRARLGREG